MADGASQVNVRWIDGKRLEVSARGNRLIVDQVSADGREDTGFRPTDLLLGALGACTMGTVLTFCNNMKIPVDSFEIDVEGKRDTAPERVSEIQVSLQSFRRYSGRTPGDAQARSRRVPDSLHDQALAKNRNETEGGRKDGLTNIGVRVARGFLPTRRRTVPAAILMEQTNHTERVHDSRESEIREEPRVG